MDSHSYSQPSLSPTDYFNGLELTTPVQPGSGPRSYKSRKYRPCDFCRARQVACKIDIAPPCQLCSSHGRQCTFLERPKKKRRPNASSSNGENGMSGGSGSSTSSWAHVVARSLWLTRNACSPDSAAVRCIWDPAEPRLPCTIQQRPFLQWHEWS